MKRFEWREAASLREALELAGEASVLKGGGLDLLDLMKEGLASPRRIVNLRSVPELGRIDEAPGGGLRIGSGVTLSAIAADERIARRYRALSDAAAGTASPQIRNVATLGGNLLQRPRCWYFRSRDHRCIRKGGSACFAFGGENQYHAIFGHNGCAMVHPSSCATALVAFGARLELRSAGKARVVALEEFLLRPEQDIHRENDLKPGELLAAVILPPAPRSRSAHWRQRELDSFDWPIAEAAVVLEIDEAGRCRQASVVLGAAAPVPYRAKSAEEALVGRAIDEEAARRAARLALAGAMPLSRNAYKLPILEALARRAILAAAKEG